MKTRNLTDLIHFTDDGARTEVLHESDKIWSQIVCLQGAQAHGPVSDASADGLLVVLSGEVAVQMGKGRARMRQWESAPIDAGSELIVRNASAEPSIVLLVLAPPPA